MRKYVICFCLVFYSHFANAGTFEQGMQLYQQKHYAQAKLIWQTLAEKGDARAQYNLAVMMLHEEKKGRTQSTLQREQANRYLVMSRSSGLVDSYYLTSSIAADSTSRSAAKQSNELNLEKGDSLTWLNRQPKTNYTIQLSMGKSRESMQITQQKLLDTKLLVQSENLYILEFKRIEQKKTVSSYALIYGSFSAYQLAKNEAEKLPESIKKQNPWIRQFKTLQAKVSAQ